MDMKVVGCDARNWIDLAEERNLLRACVKAVMNLRVGFQPTN